MVAPSSGSIRQRRTHLAAVDTAQRSDSRSSSDADNHRKSINSNFFQKKTRFSLRDHFLRTNVDVYFLCVFFAVVNGWGLQQKVVEASSDSSCIIYSGGRTASVEFGVDNVTGLVGHDVDLVYDNLMKRDVYSILFPV